MDAELLTFIAVGFAAQLVDGALGMAFGVISSTLLISLGVPPAAASAGVHSVEAVTTGVSGISHALHRNINWRLFARLVIPGVLGGVLGAYVLTQIAAEVARPMVLAYLSAIGFILIWRGFGHPPKRVELKRATPLGLIGGFLDASGGGGWGAIVTSHLLLQGQNPRQVIGTVCLAEFFLTLTVSATFLLTLGPDFLTRAMLGLLIGGVLAAPLGAVLAKRLPARPLLTMVGLILVLTSAFGIYRAFAA
jgi:uncharacterized membrane protein YfcA